MPDGERRQREDVGLDVGVGEGEHGLRLSRSQR
jgi:hypothetical protein